MDGLLNQAKGALGGAGGAAGQQQQGQNTANAAQGATGATGATGGSTGQQDALDKGVGAVLGKAGYGQDAATTEKISDGIRSAYKSGTGKDFPIQDKQ